MIMNMMNVTVRPTKTKMSDYDDDGDDNDKQLRPITSFNLIVISSMFISVKKVDVICYCYPRRYQLPAVLFGLGFFDVRLRVVFFLVVPGIRIASS